MKRGVFGGSFDPVHIGHVTVAEAAAAALALDVVHVVPAFRQPLKPAPHASPSDRAAMLRLAVGPSFPLVVDERELDRAGPSYTVDTLEELHREFPNDELTLLIGADAAAGLPDWRASARVAELADIVVLTRPGVEVPRRLAGASVSVPAVRVSATDIRDRVRSGQSISGLVPEAVEAYIVEHGLYR